jgi:hypothetical protein
MNVNSQRIGLFLVIGLGLLCAYFTGVNVAEEDNTSIAAILALLGVGAFFLGTGTRLYLLIPICWGLSGQIRILPLPFSVSQLVIILASLLFITTIIFKGRQRKIKYEKIDLLLIINLSYLMIVFFRNPVGIAAIGGGERVGGKPYVDVLLGIMAYLIISRQIISARFSKKLPLLMLIISIFTMFAGMVGFLIPEIAAKVAPIYSSFSPSRGIDGGNELISVGETRLAFLAPGGCNIILYVVSCVNPLRLMNFANLSKLLSYCAGIIMILLSGFRNSIFNAFLITLISITIRDRFVGVVKLLSISFILVISIICISFSQIKIPSTFSRSLSFLPGDWDQDAVLSAKDSTEWRHEMWKIVLTSDKYIRSKMWGDGFGFLRSDFEIMMASKMSGRKGFGGVNAAQEAFMIDGDFHSGPVTSIRFVGLFGLLLFMPLLIALAIYAYKTIILCVSTPYQICAYFIGIPCIILPFFFVFIFGDFRADLIAVLFDIAMLKMIRASLNTYKITYSPTTGSKQPVGT